MSTHEDFSRKEQIKGASDRSFGLVFAVFFAILALWPVISRDAPRWWAVFLSAGFAIAALLFPRVLHPANWAWTKFGLLLNRFTNPIITGLVFFLAVTPTGLLMKMFGKNPLRLGYEPEAQTYWIERRPPGPAPESMSNQF